MAGNRDSHFNGDRSGNWLANYPKRGAAWRGAGAMVLARCCLASTALRAIDWQILLVIAAAFGIGTAVESIGAAAVIAGSLINLVGDNSYSTLALIYGVTMLFTELITINAAAVLMFPIALATAEKIGANPMPFVIAIMMAASARFLNTDRLSDEPDGVWAGWIPLQRLPAHRSADEFNAVDRVGYHDTAGLGFLIL